MTQYTNAQYCKDHTGQTVVSIKVTHEGSMLSIPLDPENSDYAEILKQVKEKKLTIKEAD